MECRLFLTFPYAFFIARHINTYPFHTAMAKEAFSTLLGQFRLNNHTLIDQQRYKDVLDVLSSEKRKKAEAVFLQKHKMKEYAAEIFPCLPVLFSAYAAANISLTKHQVQASVVLDNFISNAINNITDIDQTLQILVKRLREWYSLVLPELEHRISDNEKLVDLLIHFSRDQLMQQFSCQETMGAILEKKDMQPILALAQQIQGLYQLKKQHTAYLTSLLTTYTPNTVALLGVELTAELIEHAGSLQHLAMLPSSTIQLLGAEKALFQHLTQHTRCPKHGLLVKHPLLANAKEKDRGKIARQLASAAAQCVRLDYFHGKKDRGAVLLAKLTASYRR